MSFGFLVLSHTPQCSGLHSGSALRNHSWWNQGTIWDTGDTTWICACKATTLPTVVSLWLQRLYLVVWFCLGSHLLVLRDYIWLYAHELDFCIMTLSHQARHQERGAMRGEQVDSKKVSSEIQEQPQKLCGQHNCPPLRVLFFFHQISLKKSTGGWGSAQGSVSKGIGCQEHNLLETLTLWDLGSRREGRSLL